MNEGPGKRPKGIAGTWSAHDPMVSMNTRYVGYLCFGEGGAYDFFDLSFLDTNSLANANGMQRNRGSWTLSGDTLRVRETDWGFLSDPNGIGPDWPRKIAMKPRTDSSLARILIRNDTLVIYRPDGQVRATTRQSPHPLIQAVCTD